MEPRSGDDRCDLEYGPLDEIAREGELMVYKHEGFWACMDTYRDYEYINKLWAQGEAHWQVWSRCPNNYELIRAL